MFRPRRSLVLGAALALALAVPAVARAAPASTALDWFGDLWAAVQAQIATLAGEAQPPASEAVETQAPAPSPSSGDGGSSIDPDG